MNRGTLTAPPLSDLKKIQAVTPQGYFTILRDLDFFSDDKLGIQKSFYVMPDVQYFW